MHRGFRCWRMQKKVMSFSACYYSDNLFLKPTKKNKQNVDTSSLCCGRKPLATLVHAGPVTIHLYI